MATKRGKRPTKKVKGLKSKSLSAGKAKGVRGGVRFKVGMKEGVAAKINDLNLNRLYFK